MTTRNITIIPPEDLQIKTKEIFSNAVTTTSFYQDDTDIPITAGYGTRQRTLEIPVVGDGNITIASMNFTASASLTGSPTTGRTISVDVYMGLFDVLNSVTVAEFHTTAAYILCTINSVGFFTYGYRPIEVFAEQLTEGTDYKYYIDVVREQSNAGMGVDPVVTFQTLQLLTRKR